MPKRLFGSVTAALVVLMLGTALAGASSAAADDHGDGGVVRAAVPEGAIDHVIVIDLENENFADTFGAGSPATYLNGVLRAKGQLIEQYYATSHVSLGNYTSQVSGQATNPTLNNDCLDLSTLRNPPVKGGFTNVVPGTDVGNGQVLGDGCVFPSPTTTTHGARTIGDQLDQLSRKDDHEDDDVANLTWRAYIEDMGNDPVRDGGTADPMGGTTCAHPPIGRADNTNSAAANDQYATRHNPFVYFHSVIDDQARCDQHVVPLGTVHVGTSGAADTFAGHLAQDLERERTTPAYSFITPNLCNDGHDATCTGPNVEGGSTGGLVGLDLWLKHWMPLIFESPAYRSGKTLVVVTFDEANPVGAAADSRACCNEPSGPNVTNPGFSGVLGLFGLQTPPAAGTTPYPGGGQIGALVFNPRWVKAGSTNTTGRYDHYSALRTYEDLLGLRRGGDDGLGHLGYAGQVGLKPFGPDVFDARR